MFLFVPPSRWGEERKLYSWSLGKGFFLNFQNLWFYKLMINKYMAEKMESLAKISYFRSGNSKVNNFIFHTNI